MFSPKRQMFSPKSLQQRTFLLILLPALLILMVVGGISVFMIRETLVEQWSETATARLERSVTMIDTRLFQMKRIFILMQNEASDDHGLNKETTRFLLEQIKQTNGVVDMKFEWTGEPLTTKTGKHVKPSSQKPGLMFHKGEDLEVSAPYYEPEFNDRVISLVSDFIDGNNNIVGHIEIKISIYDLVGGVTDNRWWKDHNINRLNSFLVDDSGNILTRTGLIERADLSSTQETFGKASGLERKTLKALQAQPKGIILGAGMPPDQIAGFQRLREAPWTLVVLFPGKIVLKPIANFLLTYIALSVIGFLLVLRIVRRGVGETTEAIRGVSEAATDLAAGDFKKPLPITSRDEIGELTRNFNLMSSQLQERLDLQQAMSVAREVQQSFLPRSSYESALVTASGITLYCNETGGDYFDLLLDPDETGKVRVVVADVVGHGVGAALLMATIRSLVRCRTSLSGSPVESMRDVNKLLCLDTKLSGHFVTLFYLVVDENNKQFSWVRCGHDPAIVYDLESDKFSELKGAGLVLGIDEAYQFTESRLDFGTHEQLILIGSDGVWDAENIRGERFGRERVKELMRSHAKLPPEDIIEKISSEIEAFQGDMDPNDDITLVIVKISPQDPVS